MIRKYFSKIRDSNTGKIKWRSHEPSRIEAFSDAIFAFIVSLLVFSLEVPKNSEELLKGIGAFIPFTLCFAIIFFIWHSQYKFFRHYGLHDNVTIFLNAVLLVTVLLYVYPLKFMVNAWLQHTNNFVRAQDVLPVVLLYNGGFVIFYLLFTFMYYNAYARREELKLTPVETFETVTFIYKMITGVCIGIIILLVAIIGNRINVNDTFICFIFYGLFGPVIGILMKKRHKLFHKKFGNIPIVEPGIGNE